MKVIPINGLIYKEVARDRLYDPLATLPKGRRCQFLTGQHGASWKDKFKRDEKSKILFWTS